MAKKSPGSPSRPAAPESSPKEHIANYISDDKAAPSYGPGGEPPRLRSSYKTPEMAKRPPAVLGIEPPKTREGRVSSWPFWTGVITSVGWFGAVLAVAFDASGSVFGIPVTSVALGLSGAIAPPALLWMVIAYLQRASDIRAITEPLRRQLQMVLGTGAQAENRVRRFNDALERQLELLRQAGDGSYDVLQSAIQVLQEEEQAIQVLAERSGKEVQRVAGIVRDNSEVLEVLLQDNRERFNDLSGRIAGHIATLDERAGDATGRMSGLIDRLHGLIGEFVITADQKLSSYGTIAGQISVQEKESVEATRRMTEMLASARVGAADLNQILVKNQELLESSGARLLARMQDVNAETESFTNESHKKEQALADKSRALGQTLATEIATLETLTGRLESQISAANEGLGARAVELEEKHGRLTSHAGQLLQGLQSTMQVMEQSAAQAYDKFATTSEQVQGQTMRAAQQFQTSGEEYDRIATKLDDISGRVAERIAVIGDKLSTQTAALEGNTTKAVTASEAVEAGVAGALDKLEVMIGRIFDAEDKTRSSIIAMEDSQNASLEAMNRRLDTFGKEAAAHINSLQQVQDQFDEAGTRLEERARLTEGTWQSLVAAAERQQEILQQQLRARIEEATGLLNDNAVALEAARDGVYMQIESAFSRAEDIKEELLKLGVAINAPFDEAVHKVQAAVSQGQVQVNLFVENLSRNAQQLVELNENLAQQEEKAGHKAAETLAGLDAVAARIEAIQAENMQTTQNVLVRLSSLVDQLQGRMNDLSATAEGEQKRLGEVVRGFSLEINGLIHDSQTADTRVRMASKLLSEQAGEVRLSLEAQAEAIGTALDGLNARFAAVATQIHEIDRLNDTGIDGRVNHLTEVVSTAAASVETLGAQIDERVRQLALVQGQLSEGGRALDNTTQAALDRLSVFTHAMVAAQGTSTEAVQQVYQHLNEMQEQFTRQIGAVSEGSQAITQGMREAVTDLVQQSVALAAASEAGQVRVGGLLEVTQMLEAEAEKTRGTVEERVLGMHARLGSVLAEIESASVGLERHAAIAFDRSEGMARRFEGLSENAFGVLNATAEQVGRIADASVAKVEDVNRALTEQTEKITFAGVHLAELETELRQSAERDAAHLNQLAAEAGGKAIYASDQLRQQIEGLKGEADGMLGRFDSLGQGLARQSTGAVQSLADLQENVERMQETCALLGQEGRATSEKIAGQTLEFRNEVEEALQNMAATGDALQSRGDFAITMVHQMASRFAEATQNLRGQFDSQAEHLQQVSDNARTQLEEFGSRLSQHTDKLDVTAGTLSTSGQQIGETLEKANFLLRNLSAQTDRVKGGVQEIGGAMLQRLSEMLCTFEDELKGLTTNAGAGLEELSRKAEGLGIQLRSESRSISEALTNDIGQALTGTTAQIAGMQEEFRTALSSASETLIGHLRRVQESGTGIMDVMRNGTTAGAEQALQVLQRLRGTAEQEVRGMNSAIEQNVALMQNFSERLRNEFAASSDETRGAAQLIFARVRKGVEEEMQTLLARTGMALKDMQTACETMTREMKQSLTQAESTGQNFGRIAEQMRMDSSRTATTVTEAGQSLSSTHALLQRSQATLFDVAQKSGEALTLFNDNLVQQTRQLSSFQSNMMQASQNIGQTDERLAVLKDGFEAVISDLVDKLNGGLYSLSQQMLTVRGEAEATVTTIHQSAESLADQNGLTAMTAGTLAKALTQLEGISRALSTNLKENASEVEGRAVAMEEQAGRVRRAGDTASLAIDALGTRIQNHLAHIENAAQAMRAPLEQFDGLNERFNTTLSLANQAASRVAPLVPKEAKLEPAPRAPMPTAMAAAASAPPIAAPAAPRPAYTPPAPAPKPPTQQEEAVRDMMDRLKEASETRLGAAPRPPVAPPAIQRPVSSRGDTELVASLTQIIQQLEENTGAGKTAPAAEPKKIVK